MNPSARLVASLAIALAGCAQHSLGVIPPPIVPSQLGVVNPAVSQRGDGSTWQQFTPKTHGPLWDNIAAGPDGNMWFVDYNGHALARVSMIGASKEYDLPVASPYDLAVGADKHFYINDFGSTIVRTDTHGNSSVLTIPSGDTTQYDGIATGPDGNVWFTEYNHIGKADATGKITEYPYPTQPNSNVYGGVTGGPDGNVWFSESNHNAIGVINPATGKIKEYPIPQGCTPAPIVSAADGNLWFACLGSVSSVGSVTTHGVITMYQTGLTQGGNATLQTGAEGPDGAPWFASGDGGFVYRFDTKSHVVTQFSPPGGQHPNALAAGPDGNIWITTLNPAHIEVLVLNALTVSPDSVKFPSLGATKTLTVSEGGTKSWTAASSRKSVATVSKGSKATEFIVTPIGAGKCSITISDGVGNSARIPVMVE